MPAEAVDKVVLMPADFVLMPVLADVETVMIPVELVLMPVLLNTRLPGQAFTKPQYPQIPKPLMLAELVLIPAELVLIPAELVLIPAEAVDKLVLMLKMLVLIEAKLTTNMTRPSLRNNLEAGRT